MPYYKIWLKDKRETVVEGDTLELQTHLDHGRTPGDVIVKKGDTIVAHFRVGDVAGYTTHETDPSIPFVG